MRVLLAGSTGVLGRRLTRLLVDAGHSVVGLTRDERGDEIIQAGGGEPSRANLFNPDEVTYAAEGCEAVVHAATAIPKKARPSEDDWRINDEIRIKGTRSLLEVVERIGARQFIFQSIVWVARPSDDAPFDENTPSEPDAATRSADSAERMALDAAQQHGFVTTVLRGGWFYAPDAWHTRSFGESLSRRMLPIVGKGDAYWSILHVEDAASSYLMAIEQRTAGIYHVVDDEPVQVGDFFRAFAERLGAKPPIRVPVWLAKLAAGSYAVEFATRSMITNANRFKEATGWRPAHPTYREGLDQVVRTWEAEGFPR